MTESTPRAVTLAGRKVRVGIGIASFPADAPAGFWRWVELCESSAIDSLWQTDRLQSREPFLESMATMAALAGATQRLKFGMNAVVLPYRDPLVLAKQCATIDYLSGGRLLPVFGVGADRAPEWAATGRDPAGRGRRANEALEIMQRLWTEECVSFSGEFYQYESASIAPRPVQRPLPCWIGGASDAAVRRTAKLGTGWLGGVHPPEQVARVIRNIAAALERTGRRIDPDHYGASIAFRFGDRADPQVEALAAARRRLSTRPTGDDSLAIGDRSTILARMAAYRDAGASKFVLIPIARGTDDLLEQTRRLAEEVVPEAHAWT